MDASFGTRLRLQRETQQVSLATISEKSKIKLALLEGLERDDVSRWPSGIFRRSYVRTYAKAIGLDPDATLKEFLQLYPDPADEDAAAPLPEASPEASSRRPPTRLRTLLDTALGVFPSRRPPEEEDTVLTALRQALVTRESSPAARAVAAPASAGHGHTAQTGSPAMSQAAFEQAPAVTDMAEPDLAAERPNVHEDGPLLSVPPSYVAMGDAVEEAAAVAHDFTPSRHDAPPPSADSHNVDLGAVAQLCTRLGRTDQTEELVPVLRDAARLLHSNGLILWIWNASAGGLTPAFAHGYPDRVVARMSPVKADMDNAIASAFRAGEPQVVDADAQATGAVVAPLLTPAGCAGVLALEMPNGREQCPIVRAAATFLAAQLAALVGYAVMSQPMPEALGA